jgi:uncharacterized protein YjbJ (UPF0337 family)
MADDILEKDWRKLKDRLKQHWHALTPEDIERIAGNRQVLQEVLQEKYSYSAYNAEKEVDQFINEVSH